MPLTNKCASGDTWQHAQQCLSMYAGLQHYNAATLYTAGRTSASLWVVGISMADTLHKLLASGTNSSASSQRNAA